MSRSDPGWPFRDDARLSPRLTEMKMLRDLRRKYKTRRAHRWQFGRVRVSRPRTVRWGPYKIPGKIWTSWTFVAWRWEYYAARLNTAAQMRAAIEKERG